MKEVCFIEREYTPGGSTHSSSQVHCQTCFSHQVSSLEGSHVAEEFLLQILILENQY